VNHKQKIFGIIFLSLLHWIILLSACNEQVANNETLIPGTDERNSPTQNLVASTIESAPAYLSPEMQPTVTVPPEAIGTDIVEERENDEATPSFANSNPTTDPDIIWDMLGQVDQERILTDLRYLTGVEPICTSEGCYTILDRETGSNNLAWVKQYIYEQLIDLGYFVEIQDWSLRGYSDQNLIARKSGTTLPGEEIVFIAHLDGYLNGNPAADDDASGVVCLLELARILSTRSLNRTVVLIFSSGEEYGAFGSYSYVHQLTEEEISAIKYLISIDMIGYDSDNDGAMELWCGDQPTDFVQLLSEIIIVYEPHLRPTITTGCT